ncbi:MAG TPA: terpene utilization protein AtuA, partial [Nevskia sp.]|nr:terpene utilization protein AtuA [Nevskia sp.]
TSMAQGITGFAGGRPNVTPLVRLFSCLVPKDSVAIGAELDGTPIALPLNPSPSPAGRAEPESSPSTGGQGEGRTPDHAVTGKTVALPLIALAYGRSGDKGDSANIGVLARRPEFVPLLREQLTAGAVKDYLAHFVKGQAERYELPGLHGFNFLLQQALGGGGMASLRYDPQGKMLAQVLMDFPLRVPLAWIDQGLVAG